MINNKYSNTIKAFLATWFYAFRRLPVITRLFGNYKRSFNKIEIDLTYDCQLRCFNCNRSCRQAPSHEYMKVEQIIKFIEESIKKEIKWDWIVLLGGEPTLHPDLFKILDLLLEYKKKYSPKTNIQIVSNGHGQRVNKILKMIPKGIIIKNTGKESKFQLFTPFNLAPQDKNGYQSGTYNNGCINLHCGLGLSKYGYYCCSVAAGIDRIFGFNIGRKELPKKNDLLQDQMAVLCQLCGLYGSFQLTDKELLSRTWKMAYDNYEKNRINLTEY